MFFVMAGLDPAIQDWCRTLDARIKSGHDILMRFLRSSKGLIGQTPGFPGQY
jgi:hypothetical protein